MHHAKEVVAAREAVDTRNAGEPGAGDLPPEGEGAPPEEPDRAKPLVLESNIAHPEPPDGDAEQPEPNEQAPLLDFEEDKDDGEALRPPAEERKEEPPALEPGEGED